MDLRNLPALRKICGDGILYPSTKHDGGFVFGFFAKEETKAKAKFKATRISDGQLELPVQE
jgi:hypothetical protein